jgi:hypothetical protein
MINNNIQESYCSFEVSKLLKEKGFAVVPCNGYYIKEVLHIRERQEYRGHLKAPTHALVIKWIRENFDMEIELHSWREQPVGDEVWKKAYQCFVNGDAMEAIIFKKTEEATEAALLYTLTKLIK